MNYNNSTGVNELEKIKWMVSRLDRTHTGMIDAVTVDARQFEKRSNKMISKLKERRNFALGIVGVTLTVLLSSTTIFDTDVWTFLIILTSLAIIALIIIALFTWWIRITEDITANVIIILNEGIRKFYMSNGYLSTRVADLSKLDFAEIENYAIFTQLLSSAVMCTYEENLKELAKKYTKFKDIKEALETISKDYVQDPNIIKKYSEVFNQKKVSYPELLEFIDDTLKNYRENTVNN